MPGPKLRWYETDDVTPANTLTFTPVGGTPTAEQLKHLWNDISGLTGADTALSTRIIAFARDAGSTDWLMDHPVLVAGGYEVRLTGQSGTGIPAQATAWTKLGPGRALVCKSMPSNTKRIVGSRVNVPADYGTADVEFMLLPIPQSPVTPLDDGYPAGGQQGVCHGVGDGTFSALLEGGTLAATGTPDANINLSDTTSYVYVGVPYCLPPQAVATTNLDSAAEALTSGQSYWLAAVLGSTGIEQVKGLRGTAPLPLSARPALTDDRPLLGYVEREFDATIEGGDIYQDERSFGWFAYEANGLALSVHGGWILAGTGIVRIEGITLLTLTDGATNRVWANPSGGTITSTTTATPPEAYSALLYEFVTSGGAITSPTDRRVLVGRRIETIDFSAAGNLSDEQEIYRGVPNGGRYYVLPIFGVSMALGDNGAASGLTRADVQVSASGGVWSWSSLFDADARRPSLAHDSTSLRTDAARATTTAVPQRGGIRVVVKDVPGTTSSNLSVTVRLVEV
jgi:hypothetical protein